MAFSITEKNNKSKLNRSLAISARDATVEARENLFEEDEYSRKYLAGDGDTYGINELIWIWYKELEYSRGDLYLYPPLESSMALYNTNIENMFIDAESSTGDILLTNEGFYPPDENGTAATEINLSSPFFNKNGVVIPDHAAGDTDGIIGKLTQVLDSIGDTPGLYPFSGDTTVDAITYSSTIAAIEAGETRLYGGTVEPGITQNVSRLGTGLLGRRLTINNITTGGASPNKYYEIGKDEVGGATQPTFWSDTSADSNGFLGSANLKTTLLNHLSTLLSAGDSNSNYILNLLTLKAALQQIMIDKTNTYFNESTMYEDIGDSIVAITNHIIAIDTIIGTSGDTITGDTSLNAINSFLIAADGTGDTLNYILSKAKNLGDSLGLLINTRNDFIMENGLGTIYDSSEADFTMMRKWRTFWIKARISKPKGTKLNYTSMIDSVTSANDQLNQATDEMAILFGDTTLNHYQYIPTPRLLSSFWDPKRNQDDGAIRQRRVGSVWDGQQHCTKYNIFRKTYVNPQSTNLDNTAWGDSFIVANYDEVDNETGFISTLYYDLGGGKGEGDSIPFGSELFLYEIYPYSSYNLYPTVDTAETEEEFKYFIDENGDSYSYNPRVKNWTGIDRHSPNKSFGGINTNLFNYGDHIITDIANMGNLGWEIKGVTADYNSLAADQITTYEFEERTFNKIEINASVTGDTTYWTYPFVGSTFSSTDAKSFSGVFMKGDTGDTLKIVFGSSPDLITRFFEGYYYFDTKTFEMITGDTMFVENFGESDIVRISGITTSITATANDTLFAFKPVGDTSVPISVYATQMQFEDYIYPTKFIGGDSGDTHISINRKLTYARTLPATGELEFWFHPQFSYDYDDTENKTLIEWGNSITYRFVIDYDITTNKLKVQWRGDDGGTHLLFSNEFTSNDEFRQWHHCRLNWNLEDSSRLGTNLYIDGDLKDHVWDTEITPYDITDPITTLTIGGRHTASTALWDGEITDLLITDNSGNTTTIHYINDSPYFMSFVSDSKYIYRMQNIDDINTIDGDTTKSNQSDIFDSTDGTIFTSVTGDSYNVLEIGDSHDFKKGKYIVINDVIDKNGYYNITRIEDNRIFINPSLGGDTTGTIYSCACALFIP